MLELAPQSLGPSWHHTPQWGLSGCGYALGEEGQCWEGADLLAHLGPQLRREQDWVAWLRQANGCFALYWQPKGQNRCFAAVDRIRSIPLFYTEGQVRDQVPMAAAELDAVQAQLFPYTGHTLGRHTLRSGWRQLQAGEYVVMDAHGLRQHIYYHPQPHPQPVDAATLWRVAEATFGRLIASAQGRTLVVPLSGGYDSRLIVAMLKYLGYPRVVCFTYGREASFEVQISRQVAQRLGYPWHFVPYPDDLLHSYLTEAGWAYQDFAAAGSSLAHEQDWMAVQHMQLQHLIPSDSLFVPGFGADVLAGSWRPKVRLSEPAALLDHIFHAPKFFAGRRVRKLDPQVVKPLIQEEIAPLRIQDQASAYRALQFWGLRNRMSKFLVNAVRVYEFWGYGWRLPFFDRDWMEAWLSVDEAQQADKQLYLALIKERLFRPMNIDLDPPMLGGTPWRKALKLVLPAGVVDQLKAHFANPDQLDTTNAQRLALLFCRYHGWPERLTRTYSLNFLMACSYLQRHDPSFQPEWMRI